MTYYLVEDEHPYPATHNYLILCLDSCRYDSYLQAKTPNFDKLGKPKKVYSTAGFTSPSIYSMFMNIGFYNEGPKRFLPRFPRICWLPQEAQRRGFYTVFLTPNAMIHMYRCFNKYFDFIKGLEYESDYSADKIIDDDIKIVDEAEKKLFMFNLYTATHTPYHNGVKLTSQVEAVESVDREFGRLVPHLHKTKVVVCADHGEILEEGPRGHSPGCVSFHSKLFEIPVVRGIID